MILTRLRIAALLTLLVLALGSSAAAQRRRAPSLLELTGTIRARRLRESSGVAVSRQYEGVLWTHNDSGDGPYIFAINLLGQYLGRYRVRRADNDDWEDIALAPCPAGDGDCLFIADTGDNNEKRRRVGIYIVPEPDPHDDPHDDDRRTKRATEIRVEYPNGPHDVEAIAVSPQGDVMLVSKGRSGRIFHYEIRHEDLAEERVTARLVGALGILPSRVQGRWVTAAAISPSGRRAAIRTYREIYLYKRAPDGTLELEKPACWLGAAEPQGEAIDFLDEDTLVIVSEAVLNFRGTIYRVKC